MSILFDLKPITEVMSPDVSRAATGCDHGRCLQGLEHELQLRFENWRRGAGHGAGWSDLEASLTQAPSPQRSENPDDSAAEAQGTLHLSLIHI